MNSALIRYQSIQSRVPAVDEASNAASVTGYKFIENLLMDLCVLRQELSKNSLVPSDFNTIILFFLKETQFHPTTSRPLSVPLETRTILYSQSYAQPSGSRVWCSCGTA